MKLFEVEYGKSFVGPWLPAPAELSTLHDLANNLLLETSYH